MEIQMPGKPIATNGYLGKKHDEKGAMWTVEPAYYFAQDYEMWVESLCPVVDHSSICRFCWDWVCEVEVEEKKLTDVRGWK